MTFRVFFCAGVCGLLPQADASGLMPPVCPVPAISSEQALPGQPDFYTLSPGISLEQTPAGTVRPFPHYSPGVSLEWALAEGACSPPYCRWRRIPGLIKLRLYEI